MKLFYRFSSTLEKLKIEKFGRTFASSVGGGDTGKPFKNNEIPSKTGKMRMNMYTAINDAMRQSLLEDEDTILFGEDIGFGGVFRSTFELQVIDIFYYRLF